MKNKLLLFDFDGVLVNTEEIFSSNLYKLVNDLGFICTLDESRAKFTGKDISIILDELKHHHDIHVEDPQHVIHTLRQSNKNCIQHIAAMPQAKEVLSALKIPYCIASSSGRDNIKMVLESTGLYEFFTQGNYFGGRDLGKHKPNPAVYLYAMEQMGKDPKNCVAIEDSVVGITAAVGAGIPVVGFIGGGHTADDLKEQLLDTGAFTVATELKDAVKQALVKINA